VGAHHLAIQGEGRKPSSRSRPSLLGSKAARRLHRRAWEENPLEFSRLLPEPKGPISLRSDNGKNVPIASSFVVPRRRRSVMAEQGRDGARVR
jgi:hypothetical protein